MKIAIVGTGYVGLVTAACFAELGHHVHGVDIDATKIATLKRGKSTIYEPGLEELIQRGLKSGFLSFHTSLEEVLPTIDVVFCAVATPQGENHNADLRAVFAVAEQVARHADHEMVFVNKSTVPVGTGEKCEERIAAILKERGMAFGIPVVSNPEFLKEGVGVTDTLKPDRIVVGVNGDARAKDVMEELYRPISRVGKPILFMSRESAEIVKYASNAFLATKISFINMLSELAEKTGGDIRSVAVGMGLDDRIGPRFLHAGIGYGGSCFPKDVKALMATAKEFDIDLGIVNATDHINTRQRERFFAKIMDALPRNATVAVWGLSFKPKTDDMRDSPSMELIPMLIDAGHTVRAFDPFAMDNGRKLLPPSVTYAEHPIDAAQGADAVVLLTEWDLFRGADMRELKKAMKGDMLFDGRNVYEPKDVKEAGLSYHGIGIGS